jgi:hypothetical protein
MALPPRVFYTLHEAAARLGCNIADIAGWAAVGRFRIMTGIGPVLCDQEVVAGQVVISPMDLIPLFRRCGTGPTEGVLKRLQPPGRDNWLLITDPVGGISVTVADMLILAEEVHSFEEDNDMVRRGGGGPGATSPYDWEGMLVALILRLHEKGLPSTQAELVTEMQDWFADQSDGAKIPDDRTIRRRITPIWTSLRRVSA